MRVVYDDNNTSETHNAKDTAGYDVGSDFAFLFHVSSGGSEKKKLVGLAEYYIVYPDTD